MVKSTLLDGHYPSHTFLAARPWEEVGRWLASDPHAIEFFAAQSLACAGRMPVIVHRASQAPDGLAAMRDAGLPRAETVIEYETRDDYRAAVKSLIARSQKAVTPYWTPPEIVPPESTWIDPAIQRELNNKANMADLVPSTGLARRTLSGAGDMAGAIRYFGPLPVVAKVATGDPNGAAAGVAICRKPRHVARAERRFADAEHLVIEEMLEIVTNHCVQYSIAAEGRVAYVGASSQICLPNGLYAGNLLEPIQPPASVLDLGGRIAGIGSARGYRGIAGFDLVTTRDGRTLALDLNYRLVSSTGQVLLHPALSAARGLTTSRLAFCGFEGTLTEFLHRCRKFIAEGWLVPLATLDPEYGRLGPGPARARLLIFGSDPADIARREKQLLRCGVMIGGARPALRSKISAMAWRLVSQLRRSEPRRDI